MENIMGHNITKMVAEIIILKGIPKSQINIMIFILAEKAKAKKNQQVNL